jgi:formamidopyrimidine-DNA glycosylase
LVRLSIFMPELPDITIYIEALERRILGQALEGIRLASPFLLRSVHPPVTSTHGRTVTALRRVGKRIAIGMDNDVWLVLHLMIAGRLHWKKPKSPIPGGRRGSAAFDFAGGTLILTEAGTQKRASLYVVNGEAGVAALDPGGLEVMTSSREQFEAALKHENHTLKRALTDPRIFSGIGNAYSDEILHRAALSPIHLSRKLSSEDCARLHKAVIETVNFWIEKLRGDEFPEGVTAFREGMAVHGRHGQPCPVCGAKIQRIRYASNETNYCAKCQTGGKLLADRGLSRLMGSDWPRTLEELELLTRGSK